MNTHKWFAIGLTASISACITEADVVERSSEALASDLALALQRIDELNTRLSALSEQVGESDEQASLEERVRGLTQEGFDERVQALEVWRNTSAEPAVTALEGRATALEDRATALDATAEALNGRTTLLEGTASDLAGRATVLESTAEDQDDRLEVLEAWRVTTDSSGVGLALRLDTLEGWRDGTVDPELVELREFATSFESALSFSVIAYNVASCPEGWEPYEPSFNRFLRGVAPPDSDLFDGREVGSTQEDALQGHRHAVEKGGIPELHDAVASSGSSNRASRNNYTNNRQRIVLGVQTDPTFGSARVANETRPKNVGVLYCTPVES